MDSEHVAKKIEDWKRKLVDLTKRNRSLYFSRARGSTIKIIDPNIEQIFQRLVIQEKYWQFFIPHEEEEQNVNEEAIDRQNLQSFESSDDSDTKLKTVPNRKAVELLTDNQDGIALSKILRNIYRRSRTEFEEKGVQILYITFGTLHWKELDQSEPIESPIVLVPAELTRETVKDPFKLKLADEEIVLNPALQIKLSNDFRIDIPQPPDDWEETTISEYLNSLRKTFKKYHWTFQNDCWLTLFSFHKLVIYQDLQNHSSLLGEHPLIRALAGLNETVSEVDTLEPHELDQKVHPKDSFLVYDADSSQLACIEAIKAGSNLVIQGPPGTGKSQTITNLIAEFIASGKKVLFVSEKMAALEVVYRRLQKAQLEHFCLQLHSHRANKREVVQELYKTYTSRLTPRLESSQDSLERLYSRMKQLNDYVHALHLVREPLNKSVFEILGELAKLENAPLISAGEIGVRKITPNFLDETEQLAQKLAELWPVAIEGKAFPWFGCSLDQYGVETRTKFQLLLAECLEKLSRVENTSAQLASLFGFASPNNFNQTAWLLQLGETLKKCPIVEKNWLTVNHLDPIVKDAKAYNEICKKHALQKNKLQQYYLPEYFKLESDFAPKLISSIDALSDFLGYDAKEMADILPKRELFYNWAKDFSSSIGDWLRDSSLLNDLLGTRGEMTPKKIKMLVELCRVSQTDDRPDKSWFEPQKLEKIKNKVTIAHAEYKQYKKDLNQILSLYSSDLLAYDLDDLIERLSREYSSFFRWVKPGYYKFKKQIRQLRLDGSFPESLLDDLKFASGTKKKQQQLVNNFPEMRELFGGWFDGFETNFEKISRAREVAAQVMKMTGTPVPEKLILHISLQGLPSPESIEIADRLDSNFSNWLETKNTLSGLVPEKRILLTGLPMYESPLEELRSWAEKLTTILSVYCRNSSQIVSLSLNPDKLTIQQILEDLQRFDDLKELESKITSEAGRLRDTYGGRFTGLATSWDEILRALAWTQEFLDHIEGREITEKLLRLTTQGGSQQIDTTQASKSLAEFNSSFNKLASFFKRLHSSWISGSIVNFQFALIRNRLSDMLNRVDSLKDWVDYGHLTTLFRQNGLEEFLKALESRPDRLKASEILSITRRFLLQTWVSMIFNTDSSLKGFRGESHERLIKEFRELDEKHSQFGVHRIIEQAYNHRPKSSVIVPGGETSVLYQEHHKLRGHLPVRKLFRKISNLLLRLKPCLLMSPISVSQFLDPELNKFDLVIFDEASQVKSEDAVCAIYRGEQLVVCGDNKQLPPTAFFEQGMSDELLGEEEAETGEAFNVYSSILDECCVIMPTRQRQLEWHYRSEHESLIAFSNHIFYGGRLVTFPACVDSHPDFGVKFEFVEKGIYDRGGKRNNEREAQKVMELVIEHFRRYPNQTLGVVTFSVAQTELIEDYLERYRKEHSEIERYFDENLAEKFFVKNLENVQGDERDVLIFSVGYGKDKQGNLHMNFGPLNASGGERRLNVAVTRARKKVIVASSITHADMDISNASAEGVRALYRYLQYAKEGPDSLESQFSVGEFESPLESDVASVIKSWGFRVDPQIGCSKFRIDLGVAKPDKPGHYFIGIECDGATYHSSATARDRDRLREQVLRKLGWNIHRVWSPDWVSRRESTISRLKQAIEDAHTKASTNPSSLKESAIRPKVMSVEVPLVKMTDKEIPPWVVVYQRFKVTDGKYSAWVFQDPKSTHRVKNVLSDIVSEEGPVHIKVAARRLAKAWGLQRVGDRIMRIIEEQANELKRENEIKIIGKFFWPYSPSFQLKVRKPDPDDLDTYRGVFEIAPEEIELSIINLVNDGFSVQIVDLVKLVGRIFGFNRTGRKIQRFVKGIIKKMGTTNKLQIDKGHA